MVDQTADAVLRRLVHSGETNGASKIDLTKQEFNYWTKNVLPNASDPELARAHQFVKNMRVSPNNGTTPQQEYQAQRQLLEDLRDRIEREQKTRGTADSWDVMDTLRSWGWDRVDIESDGGLLAAYQTRSDVHVSDSEWAPIKQKLQGEAAISNGELLTLYHLVTRDLKTQRLAQSMRKDYFPGYRSRSGRDLYQAKLVTDQLVDKYEAMQKTVVARMQAQDLPVPTAE